MSFWACAQLQPGRTLLARHLLEQFGYETYAPMVRESRKKVSALFPGYCFLQISLQWMRAARTPGVIRLVMNGDHPAAVPTDVLDAIRARERNGLIRLSRDDRRRDERGAPAHDAHPQGRGSHSQQSVGSTWLLDR
jgi:transcription antitermination factor NusG